MEISLQFVTLTTQARKGDWSNPSYLFLHHHHLRGTEIYLLVSLMPLQHLGQHTCESCCKMPVMEGIRHTRTSPKFPVSDVNFKQSRPTKGKPQTTANPGCRRLRLCNTPHTKGTVRLRPMAPVSSTPCQISQRRWSPENRSMKFPAQNMAIIDPGKQITSRYDRGFLLCHFLSGCSLY